MIYLTYCLVFTLVVFGINVQGRNQYTHNKLAIRLLEFKQQSGISGRGTQLDNLLFKTYYTT